MQWIKRRIGRVIIARIERLMIERWNSVMGCDIYLLSLV